MSETPWYIKQSDEPEGAYGASILNNDAADNPENRRGVILHHHSTYGSADIQRSIGQGLAILRDEHDRVLTIGGDLPDGTTQYTHIRWDPNNRKYKLVREGQRNRTTCETVRDVYNSLDDRFPTESFLFVHLVYIKNSPFNVSEDRGVRVHISA